MRLQVMAAVVAVASTLSARAQTERPMLFFTGGASLDNFNMETLNENYLEFPSITDVFGESLETGYGFYGEGSYRIIKNLKTGLMFEYIEAKKNNTNSVPTLDANGEETGQVQISNNLSVSSLNFYLALAWEFASLSNTSGSESVVDLFRPEVFARFGAGASYFRVNNYPLEQISGTQNQLEEFLLQSDYTPFGVIGARINVVLIDETTDLSIGLEAGYRFQKTGDLKFADDKYWKPSWAEKRINLDYSGLTYGVSLTVSR